MQRECARYVNLRFAPSQTPVGPPSSSSPIPGTSVPGARKSSIDQGGYDDIWPLVGDGDGDGGSTGSNSKSIVDGVGIIELYSSLKQGQTVKQWYARHAQELANIDIRRFITFGVIKGFLYRVHKYPYATNYPSHSATASSSVSAYFPRGRIGSITSGMELLPKGYHSGAPTPATFVAGSYSDEDYHESNGVGELGDNYDDDEDIIDDKTLAKYLDGIHCFDQICTELEISEKELMNRLKRYPFEVHIIHR